MQIFKSASMAMDLLIKNKIKASSSERQAASFLKKRI
jgi:hypothetical protein